MNLYYPSNVPAMAQNIIIKLERSLPFPGEPLVPVGSRVEADTVVSRCLEEDPPVVFNLAKAARANSKTLAKKLKKPLGARVEKGDILAGRNGKAMVTGTFSLYDPATGLATITPEPRIIQQTAFVRGVVSDLPDNKTVVIETSASYLRGIFGFGGQRHGVLHTVVTDPSDEIDPRYINERLTYFIIVGGSNVTAEALRRAVDFNVRGIIVGGIVESELRSFLGYEEERNWKMGQRNWDIPAVQNEWTSSLTLIVIEGFGKVPLSSKAFEMLASYEGQEVSIDGSTKLRNGLLRPEIIIPLGKLGGAHASQFNALSIELKRIVRIVTPPYQGRIGNIVGLPTSLRVLPSGSMAKVADISLEDGQVVSIPLTGFDVIG